MKSTTSTHNYCANCEGIDPDSCINADAEPLTLDDVIGILGADWTGGLSSVEFVRGQR